MTVEELIECLKTFPGHLPVKVAAGSDEGFAWSVQEELRANFEKGGNMSVLVICTYEDD